MTSLPNKKVCMSEDIAKGENMTLVDQKGKSI